MTLFKNRNIIVSILSVLFISFISCNDGEDLGIELVEDDQFNIISTDSFSFNLELVNNGDVISYIPKSFKSQYLIGEIHDPYLGNVKTELYFQMIHNNYIDLNLDTFTIDSITLDIPFVAGSKNGYGDSTSSFDFKLYRIAENLNPYLIDTLYSNKSFATEHEEISSILNYVPANNFTTRLDTNSSKYTQQLHFYIQQTDLLDIFQDSKLWSDNILFTNVLNGFLLKADVKNSKYGNLLSLDLKSASLKIYKKKGSVSYISSLDMSINNSVALTQTYIKSDFINSTIQNQLNTKIIGNHLAQIGGLNTADLKFDFSNIKSLIINQSNESISLAKLLLYYQVQNNEEESIFSQGTSLQTWYKSNTGRLIPTSDTDYSLGNNNYLSKTTLIDEENKVYKIEVNITNYLKDVIKNQKTPEMFITLKSKVENPQKLRFFGTEHSKYPAKVQVSYTTN